MATPLSDDALSPSLAWMQQHAINFIPSLLPRVPPSGGAAHDQLRDESAEAHQRQQIWSLTVQDLALLLRLPVVEFYAHALYNKSLHRFVLTFLQQIPAIWEEIDGRKSNAHAQANDDTDDDDNDDEKHSGGHEDDMTLLRGLAKRVLLVYIRICSFDVQTAALMSTAPTPSWLTGTFFTMSFSSSPLFSAGALLDLVSFYSAVSPRAHRPLLQFILDQVNARLPYAFTAGMQHAIGAITSVLATQVSLIHAPYIANSTSVKKARFVRDELKQLVRNLTSLIWSLYSMCRLRPELMRIFVATNAGKSASSSSAPAASSSPPFLALLTTLYTLTPVLLLHELGVKYAQLSAQPELMALRRGCMKLLHLVQYSLLLPAMGVRVVRKNDRAHVSWSAPKPTPVKAASSAQATTSSTLPPPLTLATASEAFYDSLLLVHSTVHEDASSKHGLCFLPTSLKNLVSFNTASTQDALLKRFNEYFEVDAVLSLLLQQATDNTPNTPGAELGTQRIERMLQILQQVDAPLLKQRIGWPRPKPAASSASSSSSSSMPSGSTGLLSRSASSKSGVDLSLQISLLADLFPSFSSDYLAACLSEYNGDAEETTKAILEEHLPSYLQQIRDKSKYRAGDQMDSAKLVRPDGVLTRQSSTGSGLLDEPVDDDDEAVSRLSMEDDDDGFEAFLKRTGRVAKTASQQKAAAAQSGAAIMLNSFDKADAMLIANKINASLNAQYDDEYDDAFDDATLDFSAIGATADELEGRTGGLYDNNDAADGGDEPDGSSYQRMNKYQPSHRGGMRGGRGGASSVSARGGRPGANYDNVVVPSTFMPIEPGTLNVRDQWRKDEERKDIYIAKLKAEKAQTIAASKRTAEQAHDYEHGLRHGLIRSNEPQHQPKGGKGGQQQQQPKQAQQQPQQQQGQKQKQQQQPQQPQSHRSDSSSSSARGGFSIRGGRGGAAGRGGSSAGLSASASSFEPSAASQQGADSTRPTSAHTARQQSRSENVPRNWDDDSDDGGSGAVGSSVSGGDARGGGQSQSGQSSDPRDRKRKEKQKSAVGNHNRKAGALKKQGMNFN